MLKNKETILKKDYIIAAFLTLATFTLCFQFIVPEVCGVYHDDAIYVITAKAIAQGDGYRLVNLPNSPKQTKYPILYPLLLSVIWKIFPFFPKNIFYMQIMTSLLGSMPTAQCSSKLAQASPINCADCNMFAAIKGLKTLSS